MALPGNRRSKTQLDPDDKIVESISSAGSKTWSARGEPSRTGSTQGRIRHAGDAEGDHSTTLVMIASDAVAILTAFFCAYWIRFETDLFEHSGGSMTTPEYWTGAIVITLLLVLIMGGRQLYGPRRNTSLSEELVNITKAISLGVILTLVAAFYYRGFSFSRVVFSLFWVLSIAVVFVGRATAIAMERRQYRAGNRLQKAVVIGNGVFANDVYEELDGHEGFGIRVAGYFADAPAGGESELASAPHIGTLQDAARYIKTRGVDLVLVAVDSTEHLRVIELLGECEGTNIDFLMVPDFMANLTSRLKVKELGKIPFIRLKGTPLTIWDRLHKRTFDIVWSSLLLVLFAPLLATLAVLVRLTSPGPILFKQRRVGLVGSEFTMCKFRSMRVGSEKSDDQAGLGIEHDPRCTPLGKFMRRTSLDELPQLFNVLKGDMSLVGPRPERKHWVEEFKDDVPKYMDRHRVKTGMTGWAQVNGLRGDTSLPERIRYDLHYIENWSIAFDIRILIRTVKSVIQE